MSKVLLHSSSPILQHAWTQQMFTTSALGWSWSFFFLQLISVQQAASGPAYIWNPRIGNCGFISTSTAMLSSNRPSLVPESILISYSEICFSQKRKWDCNLALIKGRQSLITLYKNPFTRSMRRKSKETADSLVRYCSLLTTFYYAPETLLCFLVVPGIQQPSAWTDTLSSIASVE